MTRYTVVWSRGARADLARLWLDSGDRGAVADAAHRIDSELAEDAERKGSERSEGLRQLSAGPIRVLFEVRPLDLLVEVARAISS